MDAAKTTSRALQNGSNDTSLFSGLNDLQHRPSHNQSQQGRSVQNQAELPNESAEGSDGTNAGDFKKPNQMSELDRFGLRGLLETIRSDNSDVSSLAIGHDLTTLGLNLNSIE